MVINALNSGANVFMADFEDANTPSWQNLLEGQANLMDAVRRTITFDDPQTGRHYNLNEKTAVLFVRPRGWHLPEAHLVVDGEPVSGALFDFALYFFHNARELVAQCRRPIKMSPVCQLEMTLPGGFPGGVGGDGSADERWGAVAAGSAARSGSEATTD
jgi:malate synthase A